MMFKRIIIGLTAAGFLVALVAPEAEALTSRWYRSIVSKHTDIAGATTVADRIYGVRKDDLDKYVASCYMTGLVFCDPVVYGACPVVTDAAQLTENDFVALDVDIADDSAITEADLDPAYGQEICNSLFGFLDEGETKPATIFRTFWPQDAADDPDVPDFVAVTEYTNSVGVTTIAEIGKKPTEVNNDGVLQAILTPYTGIIPCCGRNTLTVEIANGVGGTVTSSDGNIDCPNTCSATYDSAQPPLYNACPEVVLTAIPDLGYEFTGWSGGGCEDIGTGPCTTSAKDSPAVTANFKTLPILTVIIQNGDNNDRVRIFSPSDLDYTDPEGTDICTTADSPCTIAFTEFGAKVTLKKQGDSISWGGACSGIDNSVDTCNVTVTESGPNIVYVNFN